MDFISGEYVMYGTAGICRIEGKENKCFDGIHEKEYFRLIPYRSENSVYYIPSDTIEQKVRHLLTGEEIMSVIGSIPKIKPVWSNDSAERKNLFGDLLKSDDYSKIFCLIKTLYEQKEKNLQSGKRLSSADEKTMKAAENLVSQEFALVLGINPEDVAGYIAEHIHSSEEISEQV